MRRCILRCINECEDVFSLSPPCTWPPQRPGAPCYSKCGMPGRLNKFATPSGISVLHSASWYETFRGAVMTRQRSSDQCAALTTFSDLPTSRHAASSQMQSTSRRDVATEREPRPNMRRADTWMRALECVYSFGS